MYRLSFHDRSLRSEPFITDAARLLLGRHPDCDLQLPAAGVNDRHAVIERRADGYHIRDLNSANGVRLNGKLITDQRLRPGDELELGSVRLRFEIIHGTKSQTRPVDWMQRLAVAIVAALMAGQLVLLTVILSEPRPRSMRLDTTRAGKWQPPALVSADLAQPTLRAPAPASSQPAAEPAAAAAGSAPSPGRVSSELLTRNIRIERIERADATGHVELLLQLRAQVGERTLERAAVAVCVQFAALGPGGSGLRWHEPLWLPVPAWENFTTKRLRARFAGPPGELAGYVVRTYYRGRLQDIAAMPPALLSVAPEPSDG